MSETGKNLYKASQVVENSLAAVTKDFESGVASFFSGGNAKTHEPEPVKESQSSEQKQGQEQEVTTSSQSKSAQGEKGSELTMGGIAGPSQFNGQSQFSGQSQFASTYHDDGQGL